MIKATVVVRSLENEQLGRYSLAGPHFDVTNCVRLLRVTFHPQFSSYHDERYTSS